MGGGRGGGKGMGGRRGAGAGGGLGLGGGGGQGAGGGGMGAAGFCICPKCGRRTAHQPGVPCMQERCTECGVALVREGSPHHEEILARRKPADGEDTES